MALGGLQVGSGRQQIVERLRDHLFGPRLGRDEAVNNSPSNYYTIGVLRPMESGQGHSDLSAEEPAIVGADPEGDDPVATAGQSGASCIAVSFETTAQSVRCEVSAGIYTKRGSSWVRRELTDEVVVSSLATDNPLGGFEGRARLQSTWRRGQRPESRSVTVALRNIQMSDKQTEIDGLCLFQIQVRCTPIDGELLSTKTPVRELLTDEEKELEFQYRSHRTYAIGHGCAANWILGTDKDGPAVWADFLPVHEVPMVAPEMSQSDRFDLRRLADIQVDQLPLLRTLIDDYRLQIRSMEQSNAPSDATEAAALTRIIARMDETADRMNTGISMLESDPVLLEAFRLANAAMLLQMWRSRENQNLGGQARYVENQAVATPGLSSLPSGEFHWRPFQLGFLLMNIPALADSESPYRDVVDLIWFSTGGGKTEAYLLVSAFEIVRRRMIHGDRGAGTTVLSRYTLRLLTAQQFDRACTLICALESIRRARSQIFGEKPVSIGLWVGQANTPNTFRAAVESHKNLVESLPTDRPDNPFALQRCPWCRTALVPPSATTTEEIGFEARNDSFTIRCPNQTCDFRLGLPIQVVDEAMYRDPPTIVLAVVDKFAGLPREPKIKAFLGGDRRFLPPTLFIQDELHLLASSLGTVFGVYEAGLDSIVRHFGDGRGPHIIASSATVRDAENQVLQLFGRKTSVFPPPGPTPDYNFFARIDQTSTRTYVGVLAPNHSPTTSLVRVLALLASSTEVCSLSTNELDAYSTMVVYHNTIREQGKTVTLVSDDVDGWMQIIADGQFTPPNLLGDRTQELTSNVPDREIPVVLERLFRPAHDPESVRVLACTNMLSVGVDVPRLGLMAMCGQPKSTSEYIQASSRVGRDAHSRPGLVVAHYSAPKARDASHYETFHSYHQSLYRYVEPTSVTPWAIPARERCLPAVAVGVARAVLDLARNDDACLFDISSKEAVDMIQLLTVRIAATADKDAPDAVLHLQEIFKTWEAKVIESPDKVTFEQAGMESRPLLCDYGHLVNGAWPAPRSFRNVDRECPIDLDGEE